MISFFKRRQHIEAAPQDDGVADDMEAAAGLVASLYAPADPANVLSALRDAGFSEDAYFQANPDLREAFATAR